MKRIILSILVLISIFSCAVKQAKDYDTDQALMQQGDMLYKKKEYTDAITFYDELRNRFPDSQHRTQAEFKLALSYFNKKDYIEAQVYLSSFKTLHPSHEAIPDITLKIGQSYHEQAPKSPSRDQTETKNAIRYFQEVITNWPDSKESEIAKTLLEKCNDNIVLNDLYVAHFYFKKKKYSACVLRLEKAFEVLSVDHPLYSRSLYEMGVAQYKIGNKEKSKNIFEQIIKNNQNDDYTKKSKKWINRS